MEIDIHQLTKTYENGFSALKNVDIHISNGMFGLLGPNGAGKSSLMKILVTLQKATSGKVLVNGKDLNLHRKEVRSMMGYLPQDFRFFTKLKVWEFLDYSGRLSGIYSRKERNIQVDELLEKVGLAHVRNRLANKLSGGMKRRLGIAQSLMNQPKIVIVDEPTTGLDAEERIRFRNLLSDISNNDIIIILSTHIVGDISSTCEQMVLLNEGEVAFTGSPDQLIEEASGHVWHCKVSQEKYLEIKDKMPIISTIPASGGWEVVVVGERISGFDFSPVSPNLEHAYVYFMETKLNSWNV